MFNKNSWIFSGSKEPPCWVFFWVLSFETNILAFHVVSSMPLEVLESLLDFKDFWIKHRETSIVYAQALVHSGKIIITSH